MATEESPSHPQSIGFGDVERNDEHQFNRDNLHWLNEFESDTEHAQTCVSITNSYYCGQHGCGKG